MQVYLNGKLVAKEEAKISVFDHGTLYGDGVFEGLRSYNGRIFKLEEHIDRLLDSAKAIMLIIPLSKKELIDAVISTVRANDIHDGYVRLVVTRGIGDLGLDPRKCPIPSVFIIADKITLYPEELYQNGMEIITVPTRRNISEALNPCIKSLNYLNNIMAKIEAIHGGVHEALMLNSEGYVTECTGDNIFIVKNGTLITPPTWVGALKGITRDAAMEIARINGIDAIEEVLTRYDLYTADECFLTGTAAEIISVIKIDSRKIGTGKPGEITLKIMEQFKELTQTTGVEVYV
ncbi:branched-chain-amino-acid transaminase [Candidatus Desantisbacteria bacterium CG_4_8_14_3_um_filter_40_12]|uniref:Branched-chain-amino-acid aminotransferase n=3 Tax=unclassified Candidatus Desantisiibacteriota TaxID=3106372 RepID=A0A2M7JB83_9BACT|nr:MAG: branched-chain-amino-acid transaminase [Candidatus Desantisbacteria bacterium CG23_combo_of_CG06-09_8_20_14_all_40_23]PIX16637.1 MAG: branched-chain-amino-acid transaminase [Candidatus Desantisbacteria bacterium CG_4_8_14_3_um_filter_40_12]PIY20048.1 MAG: branched-chain-amino-acid transaminase [Candidatus Desantisbacteria bacterium CG_4_10_14_3_um_filter_40_18]